jgi:hypothetical protein
MIYALAGYDNCKVWDRMIARLNMKGGVFDDGFYVESIPPNR